MTQGSNSFCSLFEAGSDGPEALHKGGPRIGNMAELSIMRILKFMLGPPGALSPA